MIIVSIIHPNRSRPVAERNHLVILIRYPVKGTVKPRMIAALGEDDATALHRDITEHIVTTARTFCSRDRSTRTLEIRYTGGDDDAIQSWLGAGIICTPQTGSDVGDRTRRAIREAFRDGAGSVVVIGTDCPGLTVQHIGEAFAALHLNDVVIGPSSHGGYYLIGIGKRARLTAMPALFRGIAWGTGFVYGDTVSILKRLGLSYTVLETLVEVDAPDDLPVWELIRDAHIGRHLLPIISVVIPTLNNEALIDHVFDSIGNADGIEVIVADGGSSDDTVVRAITRGAHVVESLPGRARQLNAGARDATGPFLLFLDPATTLPPGFDSTIRDTLSDDSVCCGAFTLRIDSPGRSSRIIESAARIRSRLLHLPYRDQGLFMRTGQLAAIGGVPGTPDMEDIHLARRLCKFGHFVIVPDEILSRASRWIGTGAERSAAHRILLIIEWVAGIVPRLVRSLRGSTGRMPVSG